MPFRGIVPSLTVLCLALTGCATSDAGEQGTPPNGTASGRSSSTSAASPAATSPPPPEGVRVEVGDGPCGIEEVDGVVWVTLFNEDEVVRLDAATGKVLGTTPGTGSQPCGVTAGGGSLWTADYQGGGTTRIDLRTGKVTAFVETGPGVYDVVYARGAAWVTNQGSSTVTRVDARTNRVTQIPVGISPGGIAWSGGFLWVGNAGAGTVSKIDPERREVVDTLDVGGSPVWTSFDDDTVFVSDPKGGQTVTRIDSRAGDVTGTTEVGGRPVDGDTASDGSAWIPDLDGRLLHLDADGELLDAWPVDLAGPFVLDVSGDAVWVAEWQGRDVVRYDLG
jgi:YVTN family beta-propeller protein